MLIRFPFLLPIDRGVMLAASFWSLLDPAIQIAEEQGYGGWLWFPAAIGFLSGAGFVVAAERLLPEDMDDIPKFLRAQHPEDALDDGSSSSQGDGDGMNSSGQFLRGRQRSRQEEEEAATEDGFGGTLRMRAGGAQAVGFPRRRGFLPSESPGEDEDAEVKARAVRARQRAKSWRRTLLLVSSLCRSLGARVFWIDR